MIINTNNLQRAYSIHGLSGGIKPSETVKPSINIDSDASHSQISLKKNTVITGAERQFFAKMFPDNTKQILTHEVFTRSGKLQSELLEKGSLIDGRI